MRFKSFIIFASIAIISNQARADLDYFELEVYPYQIASPGETEFENQTSYSSASAIRSSFEANYGISDRFEIGSYLDLANGTGNPGETGNLAVARARLRGRTHFFEKGELPVDLGAYAEIGFPQNSDITMTSEFRFIIEKDFGRFTLDLNPAIEREVAGPGSKETEIEYSAGLGYRLNRTWRPHLDIFGDLFTDAGQALISPAVDIKLGRGFGISGRVGFALTSTTEARIAAARMEYEF
jgi:hypothetical protein